jgi:hypothetical protein
MVEIYFLTIIEARSPGSRCWQGWSLVSTLSFDLWIAIFTLSLLCTYLCPSLLFLKEHQVYLIRAHPNVIASLMILFLYVVTF